MTYTELSTPRSRRHFCKGIVMDVEKPHRKWKTPDSNPRCDLFAGSRCHFLQRNIDGNKEAEIVWTRIIVDGMLPVRSDGLRIRIFFYIKLSAWFFSPEENLDGCFFLGIRNIWNGLQSASLCIPRDTRPPKRLCRLMTPHVKRDRDLQCDSFARLKTSNYCSKCFRVYIRLLLYSFLWEY